MVCLRDVLVLFVNEFSKSSMDQHSPYLKALYFFVLSVMEMPVAIYGPNPVDLAIADFFAAALDPTEPLVSNDPLSIVLSTAPSGGQYHSRVQFIHYLLRTFFWHYVEKAIHGSTSAERYLLWLDPQLGMYVCAEQWSMGFIL